MKKELRPIHEITREIMEVWKEKSSAGYGYAAAYFNAMSSISVCSDKYWDQDGYEMVPYFLNNLTTFKGEAARRIKLELKEHLKAPRVK